MAPWIRGAVEPDGVRIHYLRTGGAGPPLVLLHGLMASGACWTPVARALEADFDLVLPDARGHGASSAPADGYRYDDHARDVEGLVGALGLRRPVLVGHSMGGMTAAVVASRGAVPLRAVVLVDPTFLDPERQREVWASDVAAQHRRALALDPAALLAEARARHPHRPPELLELMAHARRDTRLAALDVLAPPNPPYRDLVAAIDLPILLVIGDTSPVVTLDTAAELRRLHPRVQLAQVRDAGHGLPYDQPEHLAAVVAAFLRATPAPLP